MQRQAVLHWNRRLECLNRISQKALERSLGCFFHAQISAGNAGQPEKLNCVIRPVGWQISTPSEQSTEVQPLAELRGRAFIRSRAEALPSLLS